MERGRRDGGLFHFCALHFALCASCFALCTLRFVLATAPTYDEVHQTRREVQSAKHKVRSTNPLESSRGTHRAVVAWFTTWFNCASLLVVKEIH